ncbi:protein disulfide-isomerase precursor, partial [Coemansia aciculifera]
MDIHGYPTLKVFKNGSFYTYNGTRQESSMVAYMRKHNSPPVTKMTTPADFGPFVKSEHVVVMGFFDSDSSALRVLEDVANDFRDEYVFGYTADKATAKKLGLTQPSLVVYKDFDERWDAFKGTFAADNIRKFIKTRSIPLLGELSPQTFRTYVKAGLPIGTVFYNGKESRKELEAALMPVAKEFREVVSFAMVDSSLYMQHALQLSLKAQWPAFAIQDASAKTKYPFDQSKSVTAGEIRKFVQAFANGSLEPDYKSEPIPKDNSGNVFELVAKQFAQVAFDKSKDVLIEFYSPHCIYCRRIEPVYDELGKSLKHNDGLVIARMNGAVNDIPSNDPALSIPGYPTIVMIRAGDNKVVEYEGDRSLESFVEFPTSPSAADYVKSARAGIESIEHIDDLIREYLLFRGFKDTLKALEEDLKGDHDKGFHAEKIVDELLGMATSLDIDGLLEYWQYLSYRFFSHLSPKYHRTTRMFEKRLIRLFLVSAVVADKRQSIRQFMDKHGKTLGQQGGDWVPWLGLEY